MCWGLCAAKRLRPVSAPVHAPPSRQNSRARSDLRPTQGPKGIGRVGFRADCRRKDMLPPYPPLLPLPLLLLLAVGAELSVEAADFVPSNTDVSMVAVGVSSCPNCTAADTNCIPSSLGWSAGTVQLDASFGGPQPGYLATADGSGTLVSCEVAHTAAQPPTPAAALP